MTSYIVHYYAGSYSGRRTVTAESEDEAIAKVRDFVRRTMSLPMYADGYKIVSSADDDETED